MSTAASSTAENAVEFRSVTKTFSQRRRACDLWRRTPSIAALTQVSLHVPRAAVFAIIGPNGAGKTTLLRVAATLLEPDEGEVRIDGFDSVRESRRARRSISFALGQERSFYWRLTGRQNLEFFSALYGLNPRQTRRRIAGLASTFGLDSALDQPYEQLSTGTRQRLGLARAFLNDGSILLADEATRSLDPLSRQSFRTLLRRLSRESGRTILFTTHDLHEAAAVADAAGFLHRGRLRAVLSARELQAFERQGRLEHVFAQCCADETLGIDAA